MDRLTAEWLSLKAALMELVATALEWLDDQMRFPQ